MANASTKYGDWDAAGPARLVPDWLASLWWSSAICLALAGCVSGAPAPQAALPLDPAARVLRAPFADRTFLAASEGNLRGSIYFASDGQAVQAAQDRGIRRLSWSVEAMADGIKGPAVCIAGEFYDITGGEGRASTGNNQARTCLPTNALTRLRSGQGNMLGLGTIIQ